MKKDNNRVIRPLKEAKKHIPKVFQNNFLLKDEKHLKKVALQSLNYSRVLRNIDTKKIKDSVFDTLKKAKIHPEKQVRSKIASYLSYDMVSQTIEEENDPFVEIIASTSNNPNIDHQLYYGDIMKLSKALELGFFQNNCQCGYEIVSKTSK